MQHEQNPLDQFLKEQVENAHFDFDESYWEKASNMIDEQEQNDKKVAWWKRIGVVALFVSMVLSFGYFILNKENTSEKQFTQTVPATPHSYEMDEKTTPSENKKSNEGNTVDTENTSQSIDNQLDINDNSSKNKDNFDKNTNQTETKIKSKIKGPIAHQKNTSEFENKGRKKNNKKENSFDIKSENNQKENRDLAPKNINNPNDVNYHNKTDDKPITKQPTKNQQENDHKVWVNNQWMTPLDTQILYTPTPIDPSISNPRLVPALKDYVANKNDSTIITYHFKKDTVNTHIEPKIEKDTALVSSKLSTLYLYLQLSAAINKGFAGNINTNTTWGFSPVLSLGFGKQLNKRFGMIVQPGFTYFNAVNMEKSVRSYQYSFGIDSTDFKVTYKKMYQLQLPIAVQYNIFNKQSILAMIGLSYILNVQSKVEERGKYSTANGYRDGINPLDIYMQLGYNYQINNKFLIQAAYYQGFRNITQQTYFNIQNENKQKGIILSVRYNFIKK